VIAALVGGAVGVLGGLAAEVAVRRLPSTIPDADEQASWTVRIRRPPVLEIVGAALGALTGWRIGWAPALVPALALSVLLVPITFIDLSHRVIPNRIVYPGTLLALAAWAAVDVGRLPAHAIAAVAACIGFLALALVYPAGMGLGDVKLALMLGAFLGLPVVAAVVLAFFASAVPSVGILVARGREGRKVGIPFGPFLALGGYLALLYGTQIVAYYLHVHVAA
jgi:leader peptidase (prepilin peptidase)/N-methyltransferase